MHERAARELERDLSQGPTGTGQAFPLRHGKDGWDIGREFCPLRVLRPWRRLPREGVAAPGSLGVFKARLDWGLGSSPSGVLRSDETTSCMFVCAAVKLLG